MSISEDNETDRLVTEFRALDTPAVSDALDRLQIAGQPVGIRPVDPSFFMCGPAWTVRYVAVDAGGGGTVGDFLDEVPKGAVVVIDNRGRMDATVWGDLMTVVAHRNGVAGTLIDGVSRDTSRAIQLGYPIFARSTFMRTGKGRVTVEALGGPVAVGEYRVDPGDLVLGDSDGVVLIPRQRASEVLAAAQEISAAEERIRKALHEGVRLDDARRAQGYHALQAPSHPS